MSRYIDADALIADMQERYCKPCKEKGEDYNEVRCRACWVDDAIDDVDGFADNSIDIVRCKECRYWTNNEMQFDNNLVVAPCKQWLQYTRMNGYCHNGERKESE